MGYWNLTAEKTNRVGESVELNMDDLGHIAEQIQQGFTSGYIPHIEDQGEED